MNERISENFIMLPTVDFCFKELMRNPKVRKGFIAAILGKDPKEIRKTTLIPTGTGKESKDAKLGILDVMKKCIHVSILNFNHFAQDKKCYRKIAFCDVESGEQYSDLMELHILELKKLPPEDQNEDGSIRWMRFFGGKRRKEFEEMAKKDEYIGEAYDELKKLSLDEQKRMEYEARQKAIWDYNSQMKGATEYGLKRGMEQGLRQGERSALQKIIQKKRAKGMSLEAIAEFLEMDPKEILELERTASGEAE